MASGVRNKNVNLQKLNSSPLRVTSSSIDDPPTYDLCYISFGSAEGKKRFREVKQVHND